MIKRIAVPVVAIVGVSLIAYYFLGGFNPVEFQISTKDLTIYGQSFRGKPDDPSLEQLFTEAKGSVKKGELLTVVDHFMDSKDSVNLFIGVISDEPRNGESLELKNTTFVEGKITAHPLVRPLPNRVFELAAKFAHSKQLGLEGFSIEIYRVDEQVEILFPALTK